MPKISVIMGMYNTKSKEYLKKSIKSILNQTFSDFELIICDDGSTNDCVVWVKEICKNDSRVKLISNPENKGLAYTLNHCLSVAQGEYIARMDDDDESAIDRFEKQLKYIEEKKIDLVSCNINIFDDGGIYSKKEYPEIIGKEDFLFNSPIVHPAILARKDTFEKVNGYRDIKKTTRVEDYDLFMRMFANGIKMGVVQEYLFNYRDDVANTKRRKKYKYRINEAIIRFENFRNLGLFPKGIIYVIKPLILGIMPVKIIEFIKRKG